MRWTNCTPTLLKQLRQRVARHMTIRARLTLWYVFLLAVILVFFSIFLYGRLALSSYREIELMLAADGQQVLADLEVENGAIKWQEPPVPAGTAAALYDRQGVLVKAVGMPAQAFLPNQPPQLAHPAKSRLKLWLEKQLLGWVSARSGRPLVVLDVQGKDWLSLTMPIQENGELLGYLQVMRPLEPVEQTLHQLLLILATAIPLTLLVAVAVGLFLAQRALSPINRIVHTARAIGQGNLSERINWDGPQDELGRLAATFDDMLNRLEQTFERQRQFTADASHELRTPIAVIRAQAETALSRSRSPASYRQTLEKIVEQAEHMSRLANQLLILARADAGKESLEKEPVDLVELVQAVTAEMQAPAQSKGIELKTNLSAELAQLVVNGDQTRLTQLVINLLDNAIKYTPAPRPGYQPVVEISLSRQGAWARLTVSDNGIGIPASDLPHIFERFYRVDKARSRASGGTGLGLAIVQWIVNRHGGRIEVASQLGRGTTFTVWLPLSSASAD